jgi:hypothetical protein
VEFIRILIDVCKIFFEDFLALKERFIPALAESQGN